MEVHCKYILPSVCCGLSGLSKVATVVGVTSTLTIIIVILCLQSGLEAAVTTALVVACTGGCIVMHVLVSALKSSRSRQYLRELWRYGSRRKGEFVVELTPSRFQVGQKPMSTFTKNFLRLYGYESDITSDRHLWIKLAYSGGEFHDCSSPLPDFYAKNSPRVCVQPFQWRKLVEKRMKLIATQGGQATADVLNSLENHVFQ